MTKKNYDWEDYYWEPDWDKIERKSLATVLFFLIFFSPFICILMIIIFIYNNCEKGGEKEWKTKTKTKSKSKKKNIRK